LKKVLIVEDDLIIALSTEKMVERLGCEVVKMVTTGEDAVKSAIEKNPDVILMDIRLAGEMDGIDATMEIRKHLNGVRVIYITGNADPAYREKAEGSGFEAYLIKPVRFDELKKIIG
jgi:two-component system, response regulator PdtaR